jgi:hypothetical protein
VTRNRTDAFVRAHLERHPDLLSRMSPPPAPAAPALSPFARFAHPEDRGVIMERERHAEHGRAAQAAGAAFEQWLEDQHEAAWLAGLAELEHLHPAVVVEQQLGDGRFTGRWRGRAGADYRGTLRGGLSIAVEAKSAGRGRLPLHDDGSERYDGVKAHQRRALERTLKLGGVALLVVRFTRQREGRPAHIHYAVPWDEIADAPSLGADDLTRWEIRSDIYLRPWAGRVT